MSAVTANVTNEQLRELHAHSKQQQRSARVLAGIAISEWLERNRALLKKGPRLKPTY